MKFKNYLRESKKSDFDIQKDFIKWSKKIWDNFEERYNRKDTTLIFTEDPKTKYEMSVIYDPRGVSAIGNLIIGMARKYEIKYHPRLKSEPPDIYEKIIKHEVLHLGLSKHDREFRNAAKKWGTAPSEKGIKGDGKIRLKYRLKPRKFVELKEPEFDDPDVAVRYARNILNSPEETKIFKEIHNIEGPLKFKFDY